MLISNLSAQNQIAIDQSPDECLMTGEGRRPNDVVKPQVTSDQCPVTSDSRFKYNLFRKKKDVA
jgi:hypothetical protein